MDLDDVARAKAELPNFTRAHAESNGQFVAQIFLGYRAEQFGNSARAQSMTNPKEETE